VTALNATDVLGFYQLGPPNDLAANDSLGTIFWTSFFDLNHDALDHLFLYISSPVGATRTVTIPDLEITNRFSVAAGTNTLVDFSYTLLDPVGIEITASQPVSVYGFAYRPTFDPGQAATAFTAYPAPLLGTNYCLMSYPTPRGASVFGILATEDNTTVTITSTPAEQLDGSNVVTLQAGETYQETDTNYSGLSDVTGTRIQSDKPIVVFAGDSLVYVPTNYDAENPLMVQQFPVDQWGTQALSMGFAGRKNGDSYRVLAAYDNTALTVTGTIVTILTNGSPAIVATTNETLTMNFTNGQFTNLIVAGPVEFQANQPIQVAHFANGSTFDYIRDPPGNNLPRGDPCEILLPPTGHYLETNIVVTLPNDNVTGDFYTNFLSVIVPQSATNGTYVDNSLVPPTNYVVIGTSGYCGAQITVTNSGTHTVTSSQPVGVEVYGFGGADVYGYSSGIVK
jgi:IgGFc binding protein